MTGVLTRGGEDTDFTKDCEHTCDSSHLAGHVEGLNSSQPCLTPSLDVYVSICEEITFSCLCCPGYSSAL